MSRVKDTLASSSGLTSSDAARMSAKNASWVEYVKKYATDNNLTYKESMKAAAPSYKESKNTPVKAPVAEEVKPAKAIKTKKRTVLPKIIAV